MSFSYEYINKFKQLGIVNYTLRLIDSQENSSDIFIPIILSELEDDEENLNKIASDMIIQCTPVEKSSIIEEPIINEDILSELVNTEEILNNTEEDTTIQYTPENSITTEEPLFDKDISSVLENTSEIESNMIIDFIQPENALITEEPLINENISLDN